MAAGRGPLLPSGHGGTPAHRPPGLRGGVVVVNAVTQVAAGVAAGIHVLVFVWETLLFRRPGVHWGVFKVPTEDVEPVRLWSFNVGLYNLFLGSGTIAGLIALNTGDEAVGRA